MQMKRRKFFKLYQRWENKRREWLRHLKGNLEVGVGKMNNLWYLKGQKVVLRYGIRGNFISLLPGWVLICCLVPFFFFFKWVCRVGWQFLRVWYSAFVVMTKIQICRLQLVLCYVARIHVWYLYQVRIQIRIWDMKIL